MLEVFSKKAEQFFLILAIFFFITIAAVLLNNGLNLSSAIVLIVLLPLLFICYKNYKKIYSFIKKNEKKIVLISKILIITSIILRLSLIFFGNNFSPYMEMSDTEIQYTGAIEIAQDGKLSERIGTYEDFFPFLTPYTIVLSFFMKIFGYNYAAIVISNTLFDVIGIILFYKLLEKSKKDKNKAIIGTALWAINPLQIIYCASPLVTILINTIIIVLLYITYIFFETKESKQKTLLSILIGIVLGIANLFRPIFIIFLLAILITIFIKQKQLKFSPKILVTTSISIILPFILLGLLQRPINYSVNPYYHGTLSQGGWSLYEGANYETKGEWSAKDNDFLKEKIIPNTSNMTEAHKKLKNYTIERYKSLIKEHKLIKHLLNKIDTTYGSIERITFNLETTFNLQGEDTIIVIIKIAIQLFYYALLTLTAHKLLLNKKRQSQTPYILFTIVIFAGFFMASLLTEAMPRYIMPLIPTLFYL